MMDTRSAGGPVPTGTSRCFAVAGQAGIPSDAVGVLLNVTALDHVRVVPFQPPFSSGWLTLFSAGQSLPTTSNLNFPVTTTFSFPPPPGVDAITNSVIARLDGSGQFCLHLGTIDNAPGQSNAIVEATGYLTSSSTTQMP